MLSKAPLKPTLETILWALGEKVGQSIRASESNWHWGGMGAGTDSSHGGGGVGAGTNSGTSGKTATQFGQLLGPPVGYEGFSGCGTLLPAMAKLRYIIIHLPHSAHPS